MLACANEEDAVQDANNGLPGPPSPPTSPSAASDAPTATSASLAHAPVPTSALRSRLPWLFVPHAADCPWALAIRTLAHVALHARNDAVAEQGVEEAMRLLHKHVAVWDGETLAASVAAAHAALFAGELVPCVYERRAVALQPRELTRLLGRFHTYLPSLWTLLVAEYGALGAPTLRRLLDSLLVLLHVESMDVVRAGVAALHQMSVVVAGNGGAELDHAGWEAFADMLRRACSMDTVAALPAAQRYGTVLLVQRSIAQILQHCGRCMPPEVHLDVLSVLQASVERAAAACGDSAAVAGLVQELRSADSTTAADSSSASRPNGHSHGDARSPNGAVDRAATAFEQRSPVSDGDSGLARSTGAGEPTGAAGHDRSASCAPAPPHARQVLREQQNHGGQLLVKSYNLTIETFRESAARHSALVEARDCTATAQGRLAKLCHHVVDACVACYSHHGQENGGHAAQCEGLPQACEWSPRENAPVVCAVLRALAQQQGATKTGWGDRDDAVPLCADAKWRGERAGRDRRHL